MSGDRRSASLTVAVFNGDGLGRPLRGLPITLTVVDGERSLEHPAR